MHCIELHMTETTLWALLYLIRDILKRINLFYLIRPEAESFITRGDASDSAGYLVTKTLKVKKKP